MKPAAKSKPLLNPRTRIWDLMKDRVARSSSDIIKVLASEGYVSSTIANTVSAMGAKYGPLNNVSGLGTSKDPFMYVLRDKARRPAGLADYKPYKPRAKKAAKVKTKPAAKKPNLVPIMSLTTQPIAGGVIDLDKARKVKPVKAKPAAPKPAKKLAVTHQGLDPSKVYVLVKGQPVELSLVLETIKDLEPIRKAFKKA